MTRSRHLLAAVAITMGTLGANARKAWTMVSTSDRTTSLQTTRTKLDKKAASPTLFQLNADITYQQMDGFGAALTGSSCYNLMQMKPSKRKQFLEYTFSQKKGLGMSYVRISIGCSDFSLSEYTCCVTPGIEHFALQTEELNYVIPILKEVLAINPDLKILGSPWTCPKWMKVKDLHKLEPLDSWTSGQLNPKYYKDYATYFVKWIKAMAEHGINIYGITPQNEPLNRGNSASLYMGWREEMTFLKEALGPAFKAAGLSTRIYAFDHNYNYDNILEENDYPAHIYDNEDAAAFVTGAAYHNYGGNKKELLDIGTRYPDKELIFTETSIGMWNDGRNLEKRLIEDMKEVALGTVNNGCKAVIVWNLMLDTDRGPNREGGCQTCYGAVDIDRNNYSDITYNSHYYAIGHMAYAVRPGAVRVQSTVSSPKDGILYASFLNTDGSWAFVTCNTTMRAQEISITADGEHYINTTLPARSAASFRW